MVNGSIGSGGRHVVGRLGEPVVLPVTRLITLSLTASAWEGSESPYSQKVSAGGVDARSKVDILPPDAQSYETIFCGNNLCLIAENSGGELTVYAIGEKPLEDIVVKAAVTAVKGANGRIVGAAVGNISTGGDSPSCPVSSVNGKTGAVMLEAADVGARSSDWMPTAQEVGADSKGAAKTAVFAHDASTDSHSDIRLELKAIADRLTAFFDSDNQTLDELSEIVAYITDNKELIDSITTSKVSVVDVINNLTTNVVNKPLSAAQGVVLRGLITELGASLSNYQPKGDYAHTSDIPTKVSQLQNDSGYLTEHQDISGKLDATKLPEAINKALEQAKESGEFDGEDGQDGKSAYAYAQDGGYSGTEAEFAEDINPDNIKAELSGKREFFEDITLVENAYDESTAKFNCRLSGNAGTEAAYNGSLALGYIKVKYDPDAYVLISGIEKLVLNWDYYFAVNYYDADKNPVGAIITAHSHFGTYDGTLPCSFPIFRPTTNSESEQAGIENTEYVRIKLGIATSSTAISAADCEGLSVKIATKADVSRKSSAIPLHWETTVAEKTETVKALQTNGGKNCVSFAWASDTHIPNNAAGRTDYLGRVMARMLDNCEAPFAIITGDAVTRGSLPTEEEYLDEQAQVPLHLAPLWGTDRLLVALGNHDGCWGGKDTSSSDYYAHQFTPERMWQTFFRGQALDFHRVFSDDGLYYYVDNIAQKTRFIVLNSQFGGEYAEDANGHAVNNRFRTSCYGQTQLDWFADVALDMPSGYGAIIFTHVPPRAVNGATTPYTVDYAQFNGIINAYCNKTTYSGSFSGVAGWTSNNVSVDFTNAQGEIIALFAGHIHEDTIDTETLECPIITVTAGGAPSNNEEQIYNRPYGTGLETSFDIVTINRATKMIYCTRVGAGVDRSVSYAGVKTYTVTFVADGATVATVTYNEGATSITEPDVPVKNGYTGAWESYTLNNTNITVNAVYTEIPQEPTFTNLAEPNDTNTSDWSIWCNNARMGSDGNYRSSDNSMVTNYIPVEIGDVIYFSGTGMTSSGNGVTSGWHIGLFHTVGGTISKLAGGLPADLSSYGTFTYREDGTLDTMTITIAFENAPAYLRLCLSNAIDKSKVIISKEPIE